MHRPRFALGFVGGGLSSAVGLTHYAASQLDGRWELAAGVFSRNAETNRATARAWHVPPERLYGSWRELIEGERGRLDAVAVLLPTPDHIEVILALLDAGIPVICEKALVSSLEDGRRIQCRFDPARHFLAVTYNYSGYPMMRELRERVRGGELGRINQIQLEMPQEGFARPPDIGGQALPPQPWRLRDQEIPTICLDLGVHLHHLAYFLTGREPVALMAEYNAYSSYPDIIDDVKMWLRYDDGMSASYWMTKTSIGTRNGLQVRIYGEQGSGEWLQLNAEELRLSYLDGTIMLLDRGSRSSVCRLPRYNRMKVGHPSGFIEAFANLYVDIADALLEWRDGGERSNPYVFGLEHAVRGLELFHRSRASARDGAWKEMGDG
ncbi:MAG: oxidoreductase [Candidatus Sedimenticola endophacoides]|nr:MAG: oxidoreductase [Candidatus Sedimenticola endophacoides]OQX33550.1 MAG: oxidoreductase [Candidatus Sedimenticola endophacoides]OQX37363.1 MAG: oxidoreductase [Candidatus Sedimenticola endophacoides]OQX39249.1 MAG: oxidoreductase [Candidatus Sedimenticola endophacoides]OQX41754.1 MAG: oxidoreductase [Candidatus Sedimenticola endophacoides]